MCAARAARSLFLCLFLLIAGKTSVASAQGSLSAPQPLAPGAEALGRGGAFAAKADSPLALEYNIAGLAYLRGTHVLIDGSLFLPMQSPHHCQPWNQQSLRPCYGGMFAVSTDFGRLRRWTITAGVRVPEYVTAYGLFTRLLTSQEPDGVLIPYRWPPALFLSPSLGMSVRVLPRLALGLVLEDAMAVALEACPFPAVSAQPCSGPRQRDRSLLNPVVQLGLLARLGSARSMVALGVSARSAPNLGLRPVFSDDLTVDLPWTVRAGLRFLHTALNRSAADIELDGVAQAWTPIDPSNPFAPKKPWNSLGLRLGGSYGIPAGPAYLTARAGFVFDWRLRPSEDSLEDRIYSLSGTAGFGIEVRHFGAQLGYGYVSERFRTVRPRPESSSLSGHTLSFSILFRS